MSKRDDGGPAYPCDPDKFWSYKGEPNSEAMGMSLRDYFAGQALAGLVVGDEGGTYHQQNAAMAYSLADAMIAERSKE